MNRWLHRIVALSIGAFFFTGLPLAGQTKNKKADRPWDDISAIGHRGVGEGLNMYSLEKEIAIGKQLAQVVERSAKLVVNPTVQEYIDRLAENIRRNSDARLPIVIRVIESSQPSAFSLPGGLLYVNSGLIIQAEREAELAGVIAHHVAHVAVRHETKQATKGQILRLATVPLIQLGPGGWAGHGIYQGLNLAIPLSFLKWRRDAEFEADYFGLQYVYKAGYDPGTYVSFFGRLQALVLSTQGQQPPETFSPYPPPSERISKMEKEISKTLPERQQSIISSSEFDKAKERLKAITEPGKPREDGTNKPTLQTRTERKTN